MLRFSSSLVVAAVLLVGTSTAEAQWIKLQTPGIPRTADGKPNLRASAPTLGGKPDLSGLWRFDSDPYTSNVSVDLKPEDIDPAAVALYKERMENLGKDDPSTYRCLPYGPRQFFAPGLFVRIVQTPTMIAMLYEVGGYRTIFMDGRALPKDPNPSYSGYSVGHWEGSTLVVESIGFNDTTWLDFGGHPHTEALKATERITRTSFGQLNVEVTYEDATIYKRPIRVPVKGTFVADTEMLEYVCNENEKDFGHLVGKASDEKKLAVNVSPQILAKYTGTYRFTDPTDPGNVMKFNVTLANGTLFMDIGGKDKQELIPLSDTQFSMMGTKVDFAPDHLIFHIVEGDMKAPKEK